MLKKTRHLNEAHPAARNAVQMLTGVEYRADRQPLLPAYLQILHDYTQMNYLQLRTSDDWRLYEGQESPGEKMHNLPVLMQDTLYGELRWQSATGDVPLPLMESVATMLGRGLYFNQAQKHYQQLLLMERARHHRAQVA